MQVKDIMNPDVKTIGPKSTVQEAAKKMKLMGIGALVVVYNGRLKGIITERDFVYKVVSKALDSSKMKVEEAMTAEVVMVDSNISVEDASEIMTKKKIKKLPVIEGDNLVGIVTAMDLVAAQPKLIEQLGELFMLPGTKKVIAG